MTEKNEVNSVRMFEKIG